MQICVGVEFRMECRGNDIVLANGNGRAVEHDERFDLVAECSDFRCADERERNDRSVHERRIRVEASELAPVGIAFDRDVKHTEMDRRITLDCLREEDESGASAERRERGQSRGR